MTEVPICKTAPVPSRARIVPVVAAKSTDSGSLTVTRSAARPGKAQITTRPERI